MPTGFKYTESPSSRHSDWENMKSLLPYMWEYKGRVLLALTALVVSKFANVGVPVVLKDIVDALNLTVHQQLVLPLALLLAYGALRIASSMFNELRDVLFTRVRYRAMRRITLRTMEHLHELSLRYHLERKTGAISRDLQRGSASLSSVLNYFTFSIIPVLVEFILVAGILLINYDWFFAVVIFSSVIAYVIFTLAVMNWRLHHRQEMNKHESNANNIAMDSLVNYETVKYFNNEVMERHRVDENLQKWEDSGVLAQTSMSLLNFGQGVIIAIGVTLVMILAAQQVVDGRMSIGDLVLVNAFLLQLFIPLGMLGVIYRQIRYSLTDMDHLVSLLEQQAEIVDHENATELKVSKGEVSFEQVQFAYQMERPILHDISFHIPSGGKLAIVGASGAGKSTIARLLFRFYEPVGGTIRIDGQNIAEVTQRSLRQNIGIVPQDTVLFNESILYNIRYARPEATEEEIIHAAKMASIHDFISTLPQGYDTIVGERGLKLSGGEKQRVAIARVILKNPKILIFDEATSALDSHAERAILDALKAAARNHTTLVIAHRLSTIVDADIIMVLQDGRILEQGRHEQLLHTGGIYAGMWQMQLSEQEQ